MLSSPKAAEKAQPWSGVFTSGGPARFKEKADIPNRIEFPKFGSKKGHPHDVVDAFRCWARCISHQRTYYEDEFLMSHILTSLSGDAADVYDWVLRIIRAPDGTVDVGVLLAKFREHYCGSLTFREQCNRVENLRQGGREDAVDFLIQVGSAVESLSKDWSGSITQLELETLQYEVFLNGVQPEIRHVLDSEIAAYGRLTPDRMYKAVKHYETFIARGKRLEGNSPYTGQQRAIPSRFPKTTAFAASVTEVEDAEAGDNINGQPPLDSKVGDEASPEDAGGVYLPEFLGEAPDGDWGLNVRMAAAMQEYERTRRKCFCQSTEHLMRECPGQKNFHWPLPPRGPPKTSRQQRPKSSPRCLPSPPRRHGGGISSSPIPQSRSVLQMDWP